ncbi:hypothetical protein BC830DRAFT_1180321, partial [Chytriomyces sp. MP71]
MVAISSVILVAVSIVVQAQYELGGPTQPGLPPGCLGSFPNITECREKNWYLGDHLDQCAPPRPYPTAGQQVYIRDELNFCINLPNPNSIFLQNNYYSKGLLPTIVQAEGFVQSFCLGSYLPPGSLPMPAGGIQSAWVLKNFTVMGQRYMQVHGLLDCAALNINCTQSAPDAYDDGGQYDDGPFISCGKEPYSGVDNSTSGNLGFQHYVEQAGDGIYCMRTCEPDTQHPGLPCDVTQDRAGCYSFMGVTPKDGFQFVDAANPSVVSVASVSLPPLKTSTSTPVSAASSGVPAVSGA